MVITICGSARFRNEIDAVHKKLALAGHLVFTVDNLDGIKITKELENVLNITHRKKIDMSDAIYVINKNNYIGISTASEIEYAKSSGKEILYLEN